MKIESGTPTQTGQYVCYLPGVVIPTVVRLFIVGYGWCNHLQEPIAGKVAGWIGPLPFLPEQEYDL